LTNRWEIEHARNAGFNDNQFILALDGSSYNNAIDEINTYKTIVGGFYLDEVFERMSYSETQVLYFASLLQIIIERCDLPVPCDCQKPENADQRYVDAIIHQNDFWEVFP
jgi:hypothetical protein